MKTSTVLTGNMGLVSAQDADRIKAVREAAEGVVAKFDRRYFLECMDREVAPIDLLQALVDAGLFGIGVPEELGGSGGGLLEEFILTEVLASAGIYPDFLLVPNFARRPIIAYGSPSQVATFVSASMQAEGRPCFAITEPDAGTNSFRMRTTARSVDGGWEISGEKVFISDVIDAEYMLLVARTAPYDPSAPHGGLSLFVIPTDLPGITKQKMDIRAALPMTHCHVYCDGVRVPGSAVVGDPGAGAKYLFSALNPERILTAAIAVGLGQFMLKKGSTYARTRAPFGKPIGSYQGVAHPMARARAHLDAARLVAIDAALRHDTGAAVGLEANEAKLLASEAAGEALDACLQAHGGVGFDRETDVVTFFERIRLLRVAPINNEMILNYIAEKALDLPRSY